MTDATRYNAWREMLQLIAKYDWAVETDAPSHDGMDRATARVLRNALVRASGNILTREVTA